jgi:eukaryotic-like serine/threonine-protein kinase
MTTTGSGPDLFNELAYEFAERYRRGERPPLSEYAEKYPGLAAEIRDLFPALMVVEEFGSAAGSGANAARPSVGWQAPRQLGEYRILREVGRGGMGVVYEAVQESLGRHVALKVLPGSALSSGERVDRFRREALTAARLHHTNIVPVFGVGDHDGIHYFAMQFILGQGLDEVLQEVRRLRGRNEKIPAATTEARRYLAASAAEGLVTGHFAAQACPEEPAVGFAVRTDGSAHGPQSGPYIEAGPVAPATVSASPHSTIPSEITSQPGIRYYRSVAEIGVQVAEALQYAHLQGVLHRDVKPSNLLLDTAGRVWVTDFGLAKADDSDDLTRTGELIGTLRYMSPERLQGKALAQSDIYGLGVTLYELLTLRPAFDETHRARLIERVTHEEPPPPRRLDPHVPRDLETVVLKAIAKEPAARYASAAALAEDLRQFLADRPIRARRSSAVEKLWRWCRRNPLVASMSAAIVLLLVALTTGALMDRARLAQALQAEQAKLWESLLDRARAVRMGHHVGQRIESLRSIAEAMQLPLPPKHSLAELRTEAIAALALPDLEIEREVGGFLPIDIANVAFDGNLEHCAYQEADGTVTVRRVGDDEVVVRWKEAGLHGGRSGENLRVSRDGRYLSVWYGGSKQLVVRRLNGAESKVCYRSEKANDPDAGSFTPDSTKLACIMADSRIAVVDLATGQVRYLPPSGIDQHDIEFAPDGRRFAIGVKHAGKWAVEIRDLTTGKVQTSLPHPKAARAISGWHPDGQTLATCCDDLLIRLWDVSSGKLGRTLEGQGTLGIHCSYDSIGERLVSNDWDGVVRLWEPSSGRQLLSFSASCYSFLRVSPSDCLAALNAVDRTKLQLLHFCGNEEYRTIVLGARPNRLLVHPEGRLVAVQVVDSTVQVGDTGLTRVALVDLVSGREVAHLRLLEGMPLAWEPSGALLTCGTAGLFRWPVHVDPRDPEHVRFGRPRPLLSEGSHHAWGASTDGQTIAIPDGGGAVVLHRGLSAPKVRLQPHWDVRACAVSPDGAWVATCSHNNPDGFNVKVWEAATGRLAKVLGVPGLGFATFSPNGRWLLTTGGACRLWAVGTWAEGAAVGGLGGCFSPDGRLVAVSDTPGAIRLVETDSGVEVVRLEALEQTRLMPQSFTPDGTRLIAAGVDTRALHVWDLRQVRRGLARLGLDWEAPPYSPATPTRPLPPLRVEVELMNRFGDAVQVVAQSLFLSISPFYYLPYMRRAQAYAALGDVPDAVADYRRAWALLPAQSRQQIGKGAEPAFEEHVRALAGLLEEQGADSMQCNDQAWLAINGPLERRDPLRAVALAERAVTLVPDSATYLNTLGVVYYRVAWYREAISTLQRNLRSSSLPAFDLFYLAMCHAQLGDRPRARDCYDRAVRWLEKHRDELRPEWQEDLRDARAEAKALLGVNEKKN